MKDETLSAYSDFTKWCRDNPHLNLDSRPHMHGGAIGDGGYISDEKTRIAFAAWRAAIKADRQRRGEPVAWQPIETAPKDGTTILVYFRQHGAMTVFWGDHDYDHTSEYATWLVEDHKHGPYPVRGYSKGDDTHWMPLPLLPGFYDGQELLK